MLVCGDFIYTLEIITGILREVVNRERLCGTNAQSNLVASLVAWLRELRRTLEIIPRTLHEVVNRVRLCGHHTHRSSHGEVYVYGGVMRRGGEGGDLYCIDSVLKTPE